MTLLSRLRHNHPPDLHNAQDGGGLEYGAGEGVVRVSTQSLIALRRPAASLPLKAVSIHAAQSGAYLSAFKGRGMEFDEVRPYQPGDDIRTLDWRVTARTGKVYTKLFREERERPVLLWVDLRASMFFATRGAFKSVIAARIAAMIAWSAALHGDRLGGLIFSCQQHCELRPQRGRLAVLHFIRQLAGHAAWQRHCEPIADDRSAHQSLLRLRRVARPGSLLFLVSDFRSLDGGAEKQLMQLARAHDVIMLFVYDPLESRLPPGGSYRFSDGRRDLVLDTRDPVIRREYQARFQSHRDHLEDLCRRHGLFFLSCSTAQDVERTLRQGLVLKAS